MSEKVKLIIEIPKEDYLNAKRINWANIRPEYVDDYEYQIAHGILLEDIKMKIKDLHNLPLIRVVSAGSAVDTCLEIIDKYTSGEGGKE